MQSIANIVTEGHESQVNKLNKNTSCKLFSTSMIQHSIT